MLTWFRDNAKIFLIVIIVTFVVLVFIDWGTGRMGRGGGTLGAVAVVDGREVPPEEYDASLSAVYSRLYEQMSYQGNPSPEAELSVMSSRIREAAFEEMISGRLRAAYLSDIGWGAPDRRAADAYLKSIFGMMGAEDPEEAFRQFMQSPGYMVQYNQNYDQMRAMMFPAAGRMQNMASRDELAWSIASGYAPVTARIVVFRAMPEVPGEEALRSFYDSHAGLFEYVPYCRLRYAVVEIGPDSADIADAFWTVDSMVAAGSPPDTVVMTRQNLAAFAVIDSVPGPGGAAGPFTGHSLRGGTIPSAHIMSIAGIDPVAGGPAGDDTVTALHWETPVLPGRNALYRTMQGVEDSMADLLSQSIPWSDSLVVTDWGELLVEQDSPLPEGVPASMAAFALDTTWVDSIGPLFFSPSYQGGYPALILAKRIERSLEGGMMDYETALASGRLLMTAYTSMASDSSFAMAARAVGRMRSEGLSLGLYAEAESLAVTATPEFYIAGVLASAVDDPEAYGGILSSREFAEAAQIAPLLTPIGPFRTGGTAVVAEITGRTELPMPSDPAVVSPLYLMVQSEHGVSAVRSLLGILREEASVEDRRAEFEEAVRNMRSSTPPPVMPAGY